MPRERTEQEKLVILNLIDDSRIKLCKAFLNYSENDLEKARDEIRGAVDKALSASRIMAVELAVVNPNLGRRKYKYERPPDDENGRVTRVADLLFPKHKQYVNEL